MFGGHPVRQSFISVIVIYGLHMNYIDLPTTPPTGDGRPDSCAGQAEPRRMLARALARQKRLACFPGSGLPPEREPCELLCEDHVGTYALPYLCQWSDGAWRSVKTGTPVKGGVVAWRRRPDPS